MVAKVRKRSAVNKQAALKCYMERFKLRKLSDLEVMNSIRLRSQTSLKL